MPYPHPEPLSLRQTTPDPDLRRRRSNTVLCQSLWVPGSWCAQGLFEPSERLWREWGLILNANLPLLSSCWGFSFALGHGLSPHSRSSAYHLTGVSLTLDVRYLHTAGQAMRSQCSWPWTWGIYLWLLQRSSNRQPIIMGIGMTQSQQCNYIIM